MSKFKAGDLAIIIAGINAGHCVELVELFTGPQNVTLKCGKWVELPDGCQAWLVRGESLHAELVKSGRIAKVNEGLIVERRLMPLRGDFQPEQRKAKEEEPCH